MYDILLFILLVVAIITIHELGHFLVGKFFDVRIKEFSIGFPPRAISKKINETTYSVGYTLLGGYVSFDDSVKDIRYIENIHPFKKSLIALAGPFFNFVFAFLLFIPIFLLSQPDINQDIQGLYVDSVIEDSVAEKNGIEEGVVITELKNSRGQIAPTDTKGVIEFIEANQGRNITVMYSNGEDTVTKNIFLNNMLGVVLIDTTLLDINFQKSIQLSFNQVIDFLKRSHEGLISIIKTGSLENLTGPIGIVDITGQVAERGLADFIFFIGILSISIGYINLVPLPITDGGQFVLSIVEWIRGKRLNKKLSQILNAISIIIIFLLLIWVTISDVIKVFF